MRVLIVDDNASMRTLLSALLAKQGFKVVGALVDGSNVIASVSELSPDIVCLDYQLPGRNGLEILNEINEKFPEIDVVFMTASNQGGIKKIAADAGATGFLQKPFSQQQILAELKQVGEARSCVAKARDKNTPPSRQQAAFVKKTAIIVDDNSSIRLLLKSILNELGLHIVASVSTGEEGIRAAKEHRPDILFLDVNMPDISGIEALPKITEASPETAIVMVTGDTSREIVQQAAGLGARGYIVKPVRPAYIENVLKKLYP